MGARQMIVVALMVFLNALDGFDVLSSAFAGPGMMAEWGIDRTQLGVVLSAELVGMGFGSVLLGGMADKYGRKATMLACLLVMTFGMYLASIAVYAQILPGVPGLSWMTDIVAWRFITGLGIGGMLASTNAVVAEVTSRTGRSISMAFYVIGYPVGGVIGGFAAQEWLLVQGTWHDVFLFGAVVTAAMIPLVMLLVPETPAFYAARRPAGALEKINKSLAAFGKTAIASLPVIETSGPQPKVTDILANPRLRPITLLLSFGYMAHTFTFYYILKNAPTIVALSGYTQAEGASSLTYANMGGAIGGAIFGFFLKKFGLKGPTIAALALGVAAVLYFGLGHESLWTWRIAALLTMFFLNAAIVGYYAAFALSFPAYARASGTGFALGVGRLGAAGSPIAAGWLFDTINGGSENLLAVSAIMSVGSILAMLLLWIMPIRDADEEMEAATPLPQEGPEAGVPANKPA
ncbi:4-hydroxybenzoate transporter PcaK [Croceibacterium atlanticum]|uniref:4-hydroxybenzoate transporter PcaK n=2 Tax=Croceibacterium atlanticum TaxID=1267766 RepID=A0A0F7KX76_9SPHN|nr:4-hydroxybenzoate transporter PcaK [Croceibacterium atlanticum]